MSRNPLSNQPPSNLSVGNIVSAGLRIYRDRFGLYYRLALTATLWSIVPVYGWAKSAAILGLISRLAFGEVAERPESVADARRYVEPRKWTFFAASLLVGLIFGGVFLVLSIPAAILLPAIIISQNPALYLVAIVLIIGFIVGMIWLVSRLGIYTLPLAIEDNATASSAISRSWNLTQGYVGRLQLVWLVSFLITLPVYLVIYGLIVGLVATINSEALVNLLELVLRIFLNPLILPLYQSIQAVIYYDLITRKEGFGLKLRDF
jgi:hypothetical protein